MPDETDAKSDVKLTLVLNKVQLIIIGSIVVLIAAILLCWKFGLFKMALNFYNRADLTVTVQDKVSSAGLLSTVTLVHPSDTSFNRKTPTDTNGTVAIAKLVKGNFVVTATADLYLEQSVTASLKCGHNSLTIQLEKIPPLQAEVTGIVKNYVSATGLKDLTISLGDKTATTDADGHFAFTALNLGTYDLTIKSTGYTTYSQSLDIKEIATDLSEINLVPAGKVVFVSNRDKGKSGIYTANYDGSDQQALIARVGEYEDVNPIVSADNKKVLFSSNREGARTNGNLINKLYMIDIDGKNLTKISDLQVDYGVQWLKNTSKVLLPSYVDSKTKYFVYDTASKQTKQLGDDAQTIASVLINEDESRIAFVAYAPGAYTEKTLYVADVNSPDSLTILLATQDFYTYKYSGKEVIYSKYDTTSSATKYYSINTDTKAILEVQYDSFKDETFVKSKSGKSKIYVSSRDGKSNIFISDANGDNEQKLTSIDTARWPITWSSDEQYVLFNSYKADESALYIVSTNGGDAKKVVDVTSTGYGYGMQ